MVESTYTPSLIRDFEKLDKDLQLEVEECVSIFRENPRNPSLRTHKLKDPLKKYCSFSVNYRYRIVFEWDSHKSAALLAVGDHSVYD